MDKSSLKLIFSHCGDLSKSALMKYLENVERSLFNNESDAVEAEHDPDKLS